MEGTSDTLTIESAQPRIQLGAAVGLVFLPVFFTGWCRHFYGESDFESRAFFWSGVVVGVAALAALLDVLYSRWRLSVGPEEVRVQRQGIFRTRQWRCPRQNFQIGEVETDEEENALADRFIRLHLSGRPVRFMEGHSKRELEIVRERIVQWTNRTRVIVW